MEIVETAAKPDSNYAVKKSSLSADRVKMDVKFSRGSFPTAPIYFKKCDIIENKQIKSSRGKQDEPRHHRRLTSILLAHSERSKERVCGTTSTKINQLPALPHTLRRLSGRCVKTRGLSL